MSIPTSYQLFTKLWVEHLTLDLAIEIAKEKKKLNSESVSGCLQIYFAYNALNKESKFVEMQWIYVCLCLFSGYLQIIFLIIHNVPFSPFLQEK